MTNSYVKKTEAAQVYDVAIETPLEEAIFLSKRFGNRILIKREDLQPVHSFKLRGAFNKIINLTAHEKAQGIIAASAGNHAQGVALSAKKLGLKSIIIMPQTTPSIKVDSVKELGSEVILCGDTFGEAYLKAKELESKHGYTFIHPYDDPEVIAGQGTVAMEILKEHPSAIDTIFVPVGGGGLISGIAAYIKGVRPEIKIVGVEAEGSACLKAALEADSRVKLPHVEIFADGIAVSQIGEVTFEICKQFVDEVITVSTDEICAAIKDLFTDTRAIAEPAGATALAGLKKYIEYSGATDQTLIAINSGANINFDRLRHVAERAEAGEKREGIFAVTIPERPGSFRDFCSALDGQDISEFNYRFRSRADANIFVGVKFSGKSSEKAEFISMLKGKGYEATDLSENELAKLHVRHTVGGKAPQLTDEIIYRFQFPERPGALMQFLDKMENRWNCSLFHYRNHGAAFGRVMMGLEVKKSERSEVVNFLDNLGYEYWNETENKAYEIFLG